MNVIGKGVRIGRQELRKYLLDRVYNGKLTVPIDKDVQIPKNYLQFGLPPAHMTYDNEYNEEVRSFLKENFFKTAPVPLSLKLMETNKDFVDQELDLARHQLTSRQEDSNVILGTLCCVIWRCRKDYDAFPVNPVDWFNVAAEIANEVAGPEDDAKAFAIFRDMQYQLIYHHTQMFAQKRNDELGVYNFGCTLTTMPKDKRNSFLRMFFKLMVGGTPEKVSFTFLTTLPGHPEFISANVPNVEEMFHVPYTAITFERKGQRVFGALDGWGMSFFGGHGHS